MFIIYDAVLSDDDLCGSPRRHVRHSRSRIRSTNELLKEHVITDSHLRRHKMITMTD